MAMMVRVWSNLLSYEPRNVQSYETPLQRQEQQQRQGALQHHSQQDRPYRPIGLLKGSWQNGLGVIRMKRLGRACRQLSSMVWASPMVVMCPQ